MQDNIVQGGTDAVLKKAVDAVKRHLWGMGYSAKDFSDIPGIGYHLLVEGTEKLLVVPLKKGQKFPEVIERKEAHFVAVVAQDGKKMYAKGDLNNDGTYSFSHFVLPKRNAPAGLMWKDLFGLPKKGGEEK